MIPHMPRRISFRNNILKNRAARIRSARGNSILRQSSRQEWSPSLLISRPNSPKNVREKIDETTSNEVEKLENRRHNEFVVWRKVFVSLKNRNIIGDMDPKAIDLAKN